MQRGRFRFVGGVGSGERARPPWPQAMVGFAGDVADDGSWFAWRLTGANHRELGRSARVFVSIAAATSDARSLRLRINEASPYLWPASAHPRWCWRLQLDDEVAAVASRAYARQLECVNSLRRFVSAASAAGLELDEEFRIAAEVP